MVYKKKMIILITLLMVSLLVGCNKAGFSGTEGGKTKYQDVETDVVELTVYHYSDTPPIADVFVKTDEGIFFKEEAFKESKDLIPVSEEISNRINNWVDDYNVRIWDGFYMIQEDVFDGGGFDLNITLATGETISAHGSNAYPEGYSEANKVLNEIIAEALEEINKSSASMIGEVSDDENTTDIPKADFAGVVNPVCESSYDEINELDGIYMPIPRDAYDEAYVRIVTDAGIIDECSFSFEKDFYVYRIKKTSGPEDISGTYFDWAYTSNFNMPNSTNVDRLLSTEETPTIYGTNDGQGLIIWYKNGISYSVYMPGEASDEKLFEIYKTVMGDYLVSNGQ